MREALLEIDSLRCPRCAGQLVLRVLAEELGRSVFLTLDSACVACGVCPWEEPDQRTLTFTPGLPVAAATAFATSDAEPGLASARAGLAPAAPRADAGHDAAVRLAAAQARIDTLLRRGESLEHDLAAAQRNLERAAADERRRGSDREGDLRADVSRLEGALAEARAEVRRAEEATRTEVRPGQRAIELE